MSISRGETAMIVIDRAGPMATVQDAPRRGVRALGLAAAGPMDAASYGAAGALIDPAPGGGIECDATGLAFTLVSGRARLGLAGGDFIATHNERAVPWPGALDLAPGDRVAIGPARAGNWGYLRFGHALDVPLMLGSRATHLAVGLGGLEGRTLARGDRLALVRAPRHTETASHIPPYPDPAAMPILWGLHAHLLTPELRARFLSTPLRISARMDRMGIRLDDPAGIFAALEGRSLVSDAAIPGDIQILGDGTPVILMREAQPMAGYPRIATIPGFALDSVAQLRPGTWIGFTPITLEAAQRQDLSR